MSGLIWRLSPGRVTAELPRPPGPSRVSRCDHEARSAHTAGTGCDVAQSGSYHVRRTFLVRELSVDSYIELSVVKAWWQFSPRMATPLELTAEWRHGSPLAMPNAPGSVIIIAQSLERVIKNQPSAAQHCGLKQKRQACGS